MYLFIILKKNQILDNVVIKDVKVTFWEGLSCPLFLISQPTQVKSPTYH